MKTLYPVLPTNANEQSVVDWINQATKARDNDVSDYQLQEAVHTTIYPVPTNGSDFIGTEKAGDIAADEHHLYVVVNIGGVLTWRRTALTNFP